MRTRTNIYNYGPTLNEAKNYCRIEVNDDDALVSALITASYEQVTAECNRDFTPCTYSLNVYSGSGDIFVSTQDVNTISTGSLKQFNGSWYAYFTDTYSGDVIYTVADGGTVPNNVKVAQLMLISSWYDNRQPQIVGASVSPLDFTVNALLNPYKYIAPGM